MISNPTAAMTEPEITQANAFVKFMSRHLVVLSGLYESYDEKGKLFHTGLFAISGFILNLHDRFFWVTAGHCLDDKFDKPIRAGTLRILECGFADYFGDKAINSHKIPCAYEPGCAFYLDNEAMGLDFAVMPLDNLTTRGLIANGVRAISRENWEHQQQLSFEQYKILGIPTHLTECQISAGGAVVGRLQPSMIAVDRLDPTAIPNPLPNVWFVGQIPPEVTIQSIEGMSGGPIYGFRRGSEGEWLYHVVALQSRWRPLERITFGCSLPLFAEALHREMAEMLKSESLPEGT